MQQGMQQDRHIDKVYETAQSNSAAARSRLAASWRRSLEKHGLDPGERRAPDRIGGQALSDRRAGLGAFLALAGPRLDALFQLVGGSGCGVLLTDATGVVLERRCREADESAFRDWGLWEGADWSEAAEGTNGIGTCLAERRQVIIHRDDHFFARNIAMSCLDAPIHGPDGRLLAALDVSSARADQTEGFNRLIAATVARTAQQIEADFFRAAFPRARIVAAEGESPEGAALLAVDKDDLVIGATREARRAFGLDAEGGLKPRPATDILGRDGAEQGLDRAERAAIVRALARADGNVSAAARALGMGRATLYRRMNRLGIGES